MAFSTSCNRPRKFWRRCTIFYPGGSMCRAGWRIPVTRAVTAMRSMADAGAMALFTAHRDTIMTLTNIAAVIGLGAAEMLLLPALGLYGAGAAILITFGVVTAWRCGLIFAPGVTLPHPRRA